MKRFITILTLTLTAFVASAQYRITPMVDINQRTYEEVVKLITMIERASVVEKMEGIELDADNLTTSGGEVTLKKDGNSIKIACTEFSIMLEDHISNPSRRWYDADNIRTELHIQNAKMFEYINKRLSGNPRIKNMYIKVNPITGASYIQVKYYKL